MDNSKFMITDATDIIVIGGYGNHLGNLGLLNYSEDEITEMIIENNIDEYDNVRLALSLLKTIRKQKEIIEEVREKLKLDRKIALSLNQAYIVSVVDSTLQILDKIKENKNDIK